MRKKAFAISARSYGGFTLIEIIVVVVILSIAALLAAPMLGSAADFQVKSAASQIASDLDYARGLAVTHQKACSVVFDPSAETYEIRDESGNLVQHPVRPGGFHVDFTTDSRTSRVNIREADFDGSTILTFDYLGAPYSDTGTASPLNAGSVTLQADHFTFRVNVEPVTGYVTITQL